MRFQKREDQCPDSTPDATTRSDKSDRWNGNEKWKDKRKETPKPERNGATVNQLQDIPEEAYAPDEEPSEACVNYIQPKAAGDGVHAASFARPTHLDCLGIK